MKPIFENITKYTTNNYNEFLQFHRKKFSFSYNTYTIIMSCLLFICAIINIIERNFLFVLLFILLLLAFLWWRIFLPKSRYTKSYNAIKNAKEQVFTFSFYKHYFEINKVRFYYFKLYKIFDSSDYFYLYINEDTAALVNKNGFKNGKTSEEFAQFIKKKCLFKYNRVDKLIKEA